MRYRFFILNIVVIIFLSCQNERNVEFVFSEMRDIHTIIRTDEKSFFNLSGLRSIQLNSEEIREFLQMKVSEFESIDVRYILKTDSADYYIDYNGYARDSNGNLLQFPKIKQIDSIARLKIDQSMLLTKSLPSIED